MNDLIIPKQTMSSREIAELTGKRHDNVMADIKKMILELSLHAPNFSGTYKTEQGNTYECYNLPKRESLILVSGYNITMRAAIIDRWQELEQQTAQGTLQVEPTPSLNTESYLKAAKIMKATKDVLKDFVTDKNQLAISSSQVGFSATGVDIVKESGLALIANQQHQLLTVSEIGQQLNQKLTAQKVNKLLADNDYQEKTQDEKGRNLWLISPKGEAYGLYQDTGKRHSNGAPVRQFKWYSTIIEELNNLKVKS